MAVARAVLEKGTMMLLTASKVRRAFSVTASVCGEKQLGRRIRRGSFAVLFICSFSYAECWTPYLVLLSMYSTSEPHPSPLW